ncbi:tetratricopeptide repeat protein [Methylocapsa palsarum]|uniref:Doubled CXXCH domain-containing protein n=1 Tax=Methylocapsa palsarum TaxID=1612308 RepID=A0A1I3VQB0_9HYPH|nr:tetratricopeptide repeat protein [Methylocapsa palsarum]SFJ97350.1 doubled CXXCH domain-containing protein [Methylocapsa palsarum]
MLISSWLASLFCWLILLTPSFAGDGVKSESASFVGGKACAGCHADQTQVWASSHHAKAMQEATPANVEGDFANATLVHDGATTSFSRAGDAFMLRADGPDGVAHDYKVAYTFGVFPLQQYLIAFPGGRYQAFGAAWDSRPRDKGGQRWFSLYPSETIHPGDPLHWTGRDQTWNYQCAACHSTNLRKNYNLAADAYATTWTDLNVSCEACHGPGSSHIAWAAARKPESKDDRSAPRADHANADMGLTTSRAPAGEGLWRMNKDTGIAERAASPRSRELDICAPCHSRRKVIAEGPIGGPFLDSYLPALLESGLYHPDGQIDGEAFEYGSFIQSRMHRAGVVCSNCHEPHSLALRAQGNGLCAQCHLPAKFDAASHHHHTQGGEGAQCVNCHMPAKTYMVVDDRRDHSLRVPRPDLTLSIGSPNACNSCHAGKSPEWASQTVANWFPGGRQTRGHFGLALHAGRAGAADAERQLDQLITDAAQPDIARAAALALLPAYLSPQSDAAIKSSLADPSPLVRAAAPRALAVSPSAAMIEAMAPLLGDPVRAVRIEAARALAGADQQAMTPEQRNAFAAAYAELFAAEMIDAERPEAHLNLGLLETKLRRGDEADAQYQTALRLDPNFVPALVNLADLDRMRGMNGQGANLLRKAMAIEPSNADIKHSLGLALVRQKNYAEALPLLREASELAPGEARYAYVYAIAINSTGAHGQALNLLEQAHKRHPANRDILLALISISRETGDLAGALAHARELAALFPADAQIRMLVLDLEKRQPQ